MLVEIHCQVKLQVGEEDSFFCHISYRFSCHLNEEEGLGKIALAFSQHTCAGSTGPKRM
jgi:hypothetical protein